MQNFLTFRYLLRMVTGGLQQLQKSLFMRVRKLRKVAISKVQINQRDSTLLMNDHYYPLIGSTYFGLSPVHHQSSCCVDVHPGNS